MADQKQNLAEIARKKRYLHLVQKLHDSKSLTKQEIAELEEFESEPLGPTIVKSIVEVAEVMGISYRTAQRWKKAGMPMTKEGFFDLEQIESWHLQRNEKSEIKESKDFWDEKIRKYKAKILELELKRIRGEIISKEEVIRSRITRIIAIKRSLLSLPTRLACIMAMKEPREIEVILSEALGEIIDEFSGIRKLREEGNTDELQNKERGSGSVDSGGSPGMETAGEDNSGTVG